MTAYNLVSFHPRTADRAKADHSRADFFRQVMATGEPAISRPGSGHLANEPSVVIAVPIFGQSDRIVGLLAGTVSLTDGSLLKVLDTNTAPDANSYLLVSPRDNLFVAATDRSKVLQPLPSPGKNEMHDRYMSGFEGSGITIGSRGGEELSSAKHIPSAGWFLVGLMPTAQAFERIAHIRNEAMQVAGVVALLTITNTIGGRAAVEAKWHSASAEVESAQAAWKGLPAVPGAEGRELASRFERACRRFFEERPKPAKTEWTERARPERDGRRPRPRFDRPDRR